MPLAFLSPSPSRIMNPLIKIGLLRTRSVVMLCFMCGKEIGWLRSMVTSNTVPADHRKEARLASAPRSFGRRMTSRS